IRLIHERQDPDAAARDRAAVDVGDALRSRVFWTLAVAVLAGTVAMNGTIVHIAALLADRGVAPGRAALAVSALGAAGPAGRLCTGWLLDRFAAARVSMALFALAALGAFLLADAHSIGAGIVAAICIGFGSGGEVDVMPYLLARHFGLRALPALYGL